MQKACKMTRNDQVDLRKGQEIRKMKKHQTSRQVDLFDEKSTIYEIYVYNDAYKSLLYSG